MEYSELVEKANTVREQVKAMEKFFNFLKNQLKQVEVQLKKKEGLVLIVNYALKVFKSPHASN